MLSQQEPSSLTNQVWVSCPDCSTMFRVAIPSQFKKIEIVEDESDETYGFGQQAKYQSATCVAPECEGHFYILLDTNPY